MNDSDNTTDHTKEIQKIVRDAKNMEKEGRLMECKDAYLDAATLSLKMAKSSSYVEKVSYENVTRVLIQYAKDIQEEINLNKDVPLPAPPTRAPSKAKMKREKKPFDPNEGLIFVKSSDSPEVEPLAFDKRETTAKIRQLIAIKEGGLPLMSYNFDDVSPNTTLKLNEILFSGAITAINQLLYEVLERPIQTITFEDGILFIRALEDIYYVLFADEDSDELSQNLENFCNEFYYSMGDIIMESIKTGRVLTENEDVIKLVNKFFIY